MPVLPETITTMLRDIGSNTDSAAWSDFVKRYRPAMEAYLQARFPTLDPDDLVQETLLALIKALPTYRYSPAENGHFRNYLIGILRHKALGGLRKNDRIVLVPDQSVAFAEMPDSAPETDAEMREWRHSVYELALQQVLADTTIQERTKQVFLRTAVNGEPPEDVARAFGITRNAVDQMKNRTIQKLRSLVSDLESPWKD